MSLLGGHFLYNYHTFFMPIAKISRLAVQFDNNSVSDSIRHWLQTKNGPHAMGGFGFNVRSVGIRHPGSLQPTFLKLQGENKCGEGAGEAVRELRDGQQREKRV